MGKKRKHSDRNRSDRLLRRIERLEEKLLKRRRRSCSYTSTRNSHSRSRSVSSDSGLYYSEEEHEIDKSDYHTSPPPGPSLLPPLVQNEPLPPAQTLAQVEDQTLPSLDATHSSTLTSQADGGANENNEVSPLEEDILSLLGDAPKDDSPVGKDTHIDIATRLQDVLENGLKKELKDKITEEYPIPGNCKYFKAPILNAEVKGAVSEMLQKKDSSSAARQGQVGVALTALASAMDILVSPEKSNSNQILLKHISNASRLLCDSHYIDTRMRRNLLISSLNNKLKDALKESKRDKYLFGEGLPEKLKVTKAVTKTSQDLRVLKPKPTVTKNNTPSSSTSNLNWKHPQSNPSQNFRKPTATPHPYHHYRSAGPSTSHRREQTRKITSSHANRTNVHFRQHKRS